MLCYTRAEVLLSLERADSIKDRRCRRIYGDSLQPLVGFNLSVILKEHAMRKRMRKRLDENVRLCVFVWPYANAIPTNQAHARKK